ncbi:MAG: STAS domain-containing protein [Planctomycetaceae bacterium]
MARQNKVLQYERNDDTLVVSPAGDSLRVEETALAKEVARLHEMLDDAKNIVVDVGGSPYFGSLVLGSLIALCKRVTDAGGKAALCNASEGMRESLQIMKIDTIIPYFATCEEALAGMP